MGTVTVEDIAAALYTSPQRAVQQAKEWGDELHKLRGRLVSWASSYRLIERELTGRLDIETPFDAARSNAITRDVIRALKELLAAREVVAQARNVSPRICGAAGVLDEKVKAYDAVVNKEHG